ncbi:hypothetical protein CJA_0026 [Cellvibrio japonicus Ueda107]|uniref:Uncharacterized protein n=1 Tax=Cellvibrio japonicus (strain Ueda107) TaxID=498211 RepID=B3PEP7_CELJU|nr:hypothetical protein CJA_0026 [Cellvibrio japonicus Ueda107]
MTILALWVSPKTNALGLPGFGCYQDVDWIQYFDIFISIQ